MPEPLNYFLEIVLEYIAHNKPTWREIGRKWTNIFVKTSQNHKFIGISVNFCRKQDSLLANQVKTGRGLVLKPHEIFMSLGFGDG
jgi:hypothetical protein